MPALLGTQWPLGLRVATHRPYLLSLKDPPISDLSPKDPNFWFCHPKPIILTIWPKLWLVTINWSQDLKGFIDCGQLDVLYSINFCFLACCYRKDPRLTTRSLKDPITFDLSPKDGPHFLVVPVTERPYGLRCLVALVRHSDIWVPPGA